METGFYHPSRGYWQTTGAASQDILDGYPDGTVEVPIKPSGEHEWDGAAWVHTPAPITSADVNAERDRRLYTVFPFQGKEYDCDHVSLARITGAATLAGFAVGAGAPEGYLRWHGGDTDFMWIAHDNSLTTMDAQTAFAFGQAAAENQSAHVFAADILKRQNPIPADYTDDRHWP